MKDQVYLTQQQFDRLPEYSCSLPTGTTIGKQWKANKTAFYCGRCKQSNWHCKCEQGMLKLPDDWFQGEYVPHPDENKTGIVWKRIVIMKPTQNTQSI